jgi:hypothetical protein
MFHAFDTIIIQRINNLINIKKPIYRNDAKIQKIILSFPEILLVLLFYF